MTGRKLVPRPQGLIATKLVAAEFNPRFVSRSALFAPMYQENSGGALLSIVATAGSGKSTAMAEFHNTLVDRGAKTCWLSLDPEDDNPASFAAYFVCALHAASPTLVPNAIAFLRGNQGSDFDELFEQLVRNLASSSIDLGIFLDDFHHITHPTVLKFIDRLALHIPSCVRLVIASRSELPLRLGSLRVRSLLIEIDQDALNFDRPKAAQLLKQVHDLDLSVGDLAALVDITEGWATAIQLVALAMHRYPGSPRDLINSFSGRERNLTGYLIESVLASQPENVREFLLATSPLRRMSWQLCKVVSGLKTSDDMLKYLEQRHLFLIPLDRQGDWYRYHHLFAEFLQREFRRGSPEQYHAVCEKAAIWCERNGHTTDAIQYSLDCGQFEKASKLIAGHALPIAQKKGDHYTVLDWMRRLPIAHQESHPEILLSHAWSMAFSQNGHRAIELVDRVLTRLYVDSADGWQLTDSARADLTTVALVTQAVAEATADQLDNCLAHALHLRARLPESEMFLIAAVGNCLSYCYFAKREFSKSAAAAADAYIFGQSGGADFATAWADFLLGLVNLELGRIRAARENSRRMLESSRRGGAAQSYSVGLASLLDAEISMQTCAFDQVKTYVEEGIFFGETFGPVEPLLLSIRNQSRLFYQAGKTKEAQQVLIDGQDLALKLKFPRLFLGLALEEAQLLLSAGDVDGALDVAQRTGLHSEKKMPESGYWDRVEDAIELFDIRILLGSSSPVTALSKVGLLQRHYRSERSAGLRLTLMALRAIALWRCERFAEATRELDQALAQAAGEFHAYPLYCVGADLVPILLAMGRRRVDRVGSHEIEAKARLEALLLNLLTGKHGSIETIQLQITTPLDPPAPLTERETELLRLIDAGLNNKQLANELLITEATAKWHLHNIYSKMGVRSRGAAAAKARTLKLL